MADTRVLMALARADQDRFARISEAAGITTGRLWDRYRPIGDTELAAWQRAAIPVVRAAQRVAARQRIGYLVAYSRAAGVPTAGPQLDLVGTLEGLRAGADIAGVYTRPTITTRRVLSEGRPVGDALKIGRARLVEMTRTDVMLAARAAEHETMLSFPHVVGYRRVPNAGACRICLRASTQRYHVRDLRPCHSSCRCGVAPIIGTEDPGHIIDRELNNRLKGLDATGTRVAVREHGELGPTLTNAGDHWSGPASI